MTSPFPYLPVTGSPNTKRPSVLDLAESIAEAVESQELYLRPVQENPTRETRDQRRAWEFVTLIPNLQEEGTWFRFRYGSDVALFVVDLVSSTNVRGHSRRADAQIDQTASSASNAPPCSASFSLICGGGRQ